MTALIGNERARRRLASIASEYEGEGYEVKLQPGPGDLPDFLAGFKPDLIATGKGENVVVEVKARDELSNEQSAAALESAVQNRPGWRFELIIDGPTAEHRQTLAAREIRAFLDEATDLQRNGHSAAALLLLWAATEGALRLLADREDIDLESLAAGYVLTRLYTLGLLGREQYRILDETMRLRNQTAHGFQAEVTAEDANRIAAVLTELLREVDVRAA